jgi:outer membrane lipoprotein SlyB
MKRITLTVLAMSIILAGCSSNEPVSTNEVGSVKREQVINIQQGMVTNVKKVTVLGQRSSAGGTIGRTAGSIAGGAVGSGYGSVVGSVIGSVLGGAVGSSADENLQKKPALEITVRLTDGQHLTITQLANESFKVGDKIKLIMKEGKAHVSH